MLVENIGDLCYTLYRQGKPVAKGQQGHPWTIPSLATWSTNYTRDGLAFSDMQEGRACYGSE